MYGRLWCEVYSQDYTHVTRTRAHARNIIPYYRVVILEQCIVPKRLLFLGTIVARTTSLFFCMVRISTFRPECNGNNLHFYNTETLCEWNAASVGSIRKKYTSNPHTHTREHYYYYNGSLKNALCVCERQIEREWNCCGAVGGACNRKNSWNIWLCGRGALMHQRVRIHSHQFISIQIYLSTFGSERETRFWAIIIEEPRSLIECQQVNWLFLIYKHQQKTFT